MSSPPFLTPVTGVNDENLAAAGGIHQSKPGDGELGRHGLYYSLKFLYILKMRKIPLPKLPNIRLEGKAMPQDFFTVAEVAEQLKLHAKTVLHFVHEGQLKAMRIGKQYRITPSALRAFMRGGAPVAVSAPGEASQARYIEVSSVLHIDGVGAEQAARITQQLDGACAAQIANDIHAHVDCIHLEDVVRLKIIVSGGIETTSYLLGLIPTLLRM
jgi:excisionase family DNA binding protein